MATTKKYQNISIQPVQRTHSVKTAYELPNENLSEAEMARKSTSDRTKRRVAHEAWFPLPVITRPIVIPAKPKIKNSEYKPIHIYKQCFNNSPFKTCKERTSKNQNAAVPSVSETRNELQSPCKKISANKGEKRGPEDFSLDSDVNETLRKKRKKVISTSRNVVEVQVRDFIKKH